MMVSTGPQTEQGVRHAMSLRRHIAGRSPTLDELAAVALDATGAVVSIISIADSKTHFVVGSANCTLDEFPRTHARYEQIGEFFDFTHMDTNPVYSSHPMTNLAHAPVRSAIATGIFHHGIVVGTFGVGSSLPEGAFPAEYRAIVSKLARVAESVIRSEVALSRMASEALAVLTGEI